MHETPNIVHAEQSILLHKIQWRSYAVVVMVAKRDTFGTSRGVLNALVSARMFTVDSEFV